MARRSVRLLISLLAFAWADGSGSMRAAESAAKPLKVLLLTGGGYHDYAKLAPYLTNHLAGAIRATFDVTFDMDRSETRA